MKPILLLALMCGALAGSAAEIEVNLNSGTLSDASGIYCSVWSSPDGVYLTSVSGTNGGRAANMTSAPDGESLMLYEGSVNTSNYIIALTGSRHVSGFELTFVGNDSDNPVTITAGDQVLTSSDSEQTIVCSSFTPGVAPGFNLSGNNRGITVKNLKIFTEGSTPEEHGIRVFNYTGAKPFATVYRIPVIAHIPAGEHAGRIVAMNDFRPCGMDIGYGEVDLHQSISDDGGRTWTLPADPVDAEGAHVADGDGQGTPATSNENRDCGFGDPSLVADRESGHLMMMGVCGRVPIGQATRAIPQGLCIWHSYDGGETWTQWKDITEDILGLLDDNCAYGAVDGLFFTAGRMVQSRYVKVGSHYRVYVVGGGRSASKVDTQCWVFYSDDFGESWNILGDPYKPALKTGGSEPKCEELPDGSVMYSGRSTGGVRTFNVFTYTDIEKGQGWWDTSKTGTMFSGAASCNGDALIVPVKNVQTGQGCYLLMQSTPLHASSRVNVGINYKALESAYDDFGSARNLASKWDGAYQVSSLGSAYSSLAQLADGTIGFIYEEATFGKDYCEIYKNLTVEQITGGVYVYAEDADLSVALELTRQLVDGKVDAMAKKYTSRGLLVDALRNAADAFNAEPSTEKYIAFNRALKNLIDNNIQSGLQLIEGSKAEVKEVYDLLGRRVKSASASGLYIQNGRLILR